MRIQRDQLRPTLVSLVLAGLTTLAGSLAISEQTAKPETVIVCSLKSETNENADVFLSFVADKINLEVNGLMLYGVVPLIGHSHSPNISVAANMDARGVYTLVIHRDFFLPHPIGYDPDNPPATLTVQQANEDVVPEIKTFKGSCKFSQT